MTGSVSDTLRGLLGGSAVVLAGNVVGMGGSFLARVVAARYLSPANYGRIVLSVALLNMVTMVVLLGLHQGLAQRIPRVDDASDLFVGALSVSILLALVVSGVVLVFSGAVTAFFGDEAFEPVLSVFALSLPLMVALELLVGGFRGLERADHRVLTKDILFKGSLVVGVTAGAYLGATAPGIASAWLVSLGLSTAVGAYLVTGTSLTSTRPTRRLPNPATVRSLVVFSLPLMISGASWLLMRHVDNALLGILSTSRNVGIYDAAYSLAMVPLLVSTTFSFLYLPLFSRLDDRGMGKEMKRVHRIATKWMVFLALPPATFLVLRAPAVLTEVYGDAYEAGSLALVLVVCGFFITVSVGNVQDSIIALGANRLIVIGNFAALLLNVALNVILIPPLGVVGAAAASSISFVSISLFYAYWLYSTMGIHPVSPSLVRPAVGAGAIFALGIAGIARLQVGFLIEVVLSFASLVPYLGLLLVLGGVDREEIDMLELLQGDVSVDLTVLRALLDRFSD